MKRRFSRNRKPTIFGIGLFALDLIVPESTPLQIHAGGTCGNVLAILASLGWDAYPISRLKMDRAAELLAADFVKWGVHLDYLHLAPVAPTPVIVQRIARDRNNVPFHSFSFSCPGCGGRLPQFQPVTAATTPQVISALSRAGVLFIDRVSASAVKLAEAANANGTIVFFEPSSIRNEKQFARLVQLTHVLKYSHDRVTEIEEVCCTEEVLLHVQTLGRGGTRFRYAGSDWNRLPAPMIDHFRDASGAGDWFSAGLLYELNRVGFQKLRLMSLSDVSNVIDFSQRAAAWNCQFTGARGGMYESSAQHVFQKLRSSVTLKSPATPETRLHSSRLLTQACEVCSRAEQRTDTNTPTDSPQLNRH